MYPNLKAELARKRMTMQDLAEKTGIRLQTLYTKASGKTDFSFHEAIKVKEALGVDMTLEELFATD
jgi:DNA-binding phage protein